MVEYSIEFDQRWEDTFLQLDKEMQRRVWKKIEQLKNPAKARHLKKGLPYFVEEVGQYRIIYGVFEERKTKRFYAVLLHKDYDKWLGI